MGKLKNQRGQVLIEALLLMVLLLGISTLISRQLREREYFQSLVTGPWSRLQGMVECGVWEPCTGQRGLHPNSNTRNISLDPRGN
jgi:hypothetical protein